MRHRIVIVAGATVLAGVLLWVVLQFEAPESAQPQRPVVQQPDDLASLQPTPQGTGQLTSRSQILDDSGLTRFSRVNERGTLIQFAYERLQLLPQGLSDVRSPRARIHLVRNQRVLEIRAQHGRLLAPENHPRSGELQGQVVVSLFEAPQGQPAILAEDSPHLVLRLHLEEADFDLELGQIDSEGSVELHGPQLQFLGQGLSMTYNESHKRVDRLEIDRGSELRYWPTPPPTDTTATTGPAADVSPTAPDADIPASQADDVQYYQATVHRRVRVNSPWGKIEADRMAVLFGVGRSSSPESSTSSAPSPAGPAESSFKDDSQSVSGQAKEERAERRVGGSDSKQPPVVVTWAGGLLMLPIEPADHTEPLPTSPNDVRVELIGRPLRIISDHEQVTGSQLTYHAQQGQVTIDGSPQHSLTLDSAQLGIMQARQLVIDHHQLTAQVLGPGRLHARSEPGLIEAVDPGARLTGYRQGLPAGTAIQWARSLELQFARSQPTAPSNDLVLQAASFHEQVRVEHPMFDLTTDRIDLAMADTPGQQALEQIHARGNVAVVARERQDDVPLTMQSQQMTIVLQPDDAGQSRPVQLLAHDGVVASRAGQQLEARELDVALGSGPRRADEPAESGQAKAHDAAQPAVRALTATGDVVVTLSDPQARVQAHRLAVDVPGDQLELFGQADQPARLIRPDGLLVGSHIVMDQIAQVVQVHGPGQLTMRSHTHTPPTPPAPARGVAPEAAPETDPQPTSTGELTIHWQQAMHFDNQQNVAQFTGQVVSTGQSGQATSRLETDDLRIDMTSLKPLRTTAAPASQDPLDLGGSRAIRQAVARGSVVFEAADWDHAQIDPAQKPAYRLRMEGPLMTFDNLLEHVQITGPGRMLFEDYRQRSSRRSAADDNPLVQFAGSGVTLFTWRKQLTLDALRNDMRIDDNVQMLHISGDNQQRVQLDCQSFLADLEPTGGLHGWVSDRPSQPRLVAVHATKDVTVRSGPHTITTDRLVYTGADQTVVLVADEGRQTTLSDANRPTSATARSFQWDLRSNRFEIIDVGRVTAPVRP